MLVIDSVKLPNGNEYDVMAKLDGATEGNLAAYDVNENLSDSGIPVSAIGQKQTKVLENPLVIGDTTETTVEGALGGLNDEKQDNLDLTSETETGNPLSFTTDSEQVAQNIVITFEPIQAGSGDPSPSNVRAISGYDSVDISVPQGKNLFDVNRVFFGSIGAINNRAIYTWGLAGTFTFSHSGTSTTEVVYNLLDNITKELVWGTNSPVNTGFTVTIPEGKSLVMWANKTIEQFLALIPTPQLELGSTATAYEPYNPITDISIKLNETLYGGTLDVESGKLIIDNADIDLGTLTYSMYNGNFYVRITDRNVLVGSSSQTSLVCCSIYKVVNNGTSASHNSENNVIYAAQDDEFSTIYIRDTSVANASDLLTKVSGQKLVYKLKTPITIQLPPAQVKLLQGANVVTTNGTSMSLTYRNGEVAKLSDLSGLADAVNANADVVKTSNRNLLDNPWFTINQRGQASYSESVGNNYTVDRWRTLVPTEAVTNMIVLTSDGIILNTGNNQTATLAQYFESNFIKTFEGHNLTVSLSINGKIKSATFRYTGVNVLNIPLDDSVQINFYGSPVNGIYITFKSPNTAFRIRAVKLELGSHSTLHLDTAPNYTTELLKCQRYFYRVLASADTPLIALGYAIDATRTRLSILLPTKMRLTQPTITYSGTIQVLSDELVHTIMGVNSVQISNGNIQPLTINTTGLTAGHFCTMLLSNSAYIDISADL